MFALATLSMGVTAAIAGMMTVTSLQDDDWADQPEIVTRSTRAVGSEGWLTALALTASLILCVIAD